MIDWFLLKLYLYHLIMESASSCKDMTILRIMDSFQKKTEPKCLIAEYVELLQIKCSHLLRFVNT